MLQQKRQFMSPFCGRQFGSVVRRRSIPRAKVERVRRRQPKSRRRDVQMCNDSGEELLLRFFGKLQHGRQDGVLSSRISVDSA